MRAVVLLVLVVISGGAVEVFVPRTPCPDIFNYENAHGVLTFQNDGSGRYKVELNMTVAAYTTQNIGIQRMTPLDIVKNGGEVVYRVTFPAVNRLPEITSVVFNDEIYCSQVPSKANVGYTTLSAINFFSVPMIVQRQTEIGFLQYTLPHRKSDAPFFYQSTTTTAVTTSLSSNRIFDKLECGVAEDTQALVVHGTATSEGQYPWLVALFHLQQSGEYKFKCAGNLISNKLVMTAAHCVRMNKTTNVPMENIILVLGKHNIKSWAVRSEIRDVEQIFVHPDYVKPSDADISILVMYKEVTFTDKIKPVCVWREEHETIVGSEGVVVGWGRDEFFNEYVPEPRELNMPIVSQEDCLRSDERFLKLTSNRTFCAGTRKGSGACTGDSGGGFFMKRNGRWTLKGIVSSALIDSKTRSCDLDNYTVFSDVVKYNVWIQQVMTKSLSVMR
ncbi:hypothetical protein FQA39_LY18017 [Lamprigera yunnana]|nr:hypothetical protein FQA39_LY18017 [Lamprigera yunnana]